MKSKMSDETWIELFIIELRARRVHGEMIGDAVASVRELLEDSGEDAEEAFGSPREYAGSLELRAMPSRDQALKTVLLPVLGFFAFLVFAVGSTAWLNGNPVYVSVSQALLLAVPVLLTVILTVPFYPRATSRQRWLPAVLVIIAGIVSAVAALVSPASASDAWLILSALPLLLGSLGVMFFLSVSGTIVTLRSGDDQEIAYPLQSLDGSTTHRGRRPLVLFVDWLFPALAVALFVMLWGLGFLRS